MNHLQTLNDPHILARDMVAPVDHAIAGAGKTLGTPIKLSKTPGGVRTAAPSLGQHDAEVRAGLTENQRKDAAE